MLGEVLQREVLQREVQLREVQQGGGEVQREAALPGVAESGSQTEEVCSLYNH